MAQEVLPSEYDIIILGTGTTECILAAAFARVGYKVLHLDRNDYYSGDWATFNFKALREWTHKYNQPVLKPSEDVDKSSVLLEGEQLIPLEVNGTNIHNVSEEIFIKEILEPPESIAEAPQENHEGSAAQQGNYEASENTLKEDETDHSLGETDPSHEETDHSHDKTDHSSGETNHSHKETDDSYEDTHHANIRTGDGEKELVSPKEESEKQEKTWTVKLLEEQWRKFNIDLMPKILYCRGTMVDLLISSDVAKYCEFRTVTRVLTVLEGKLQQVPCSRSDVFSSKQVSMIEKRMLMKFLTFAMDFESHSAEYEGYEDKPYIEFLKSKNLSPNVLHYILHAIAMVNEATPTIEGLKNTQRFLQSLGRYGNTAFLWPLYGASDLLQCFCRMCAVFGGTYCLSMTAQSVIVDKENKVQGVINTQGQRLKTRWLVMESSYASRQLKNDTSQRSFSRAILLVDDTIFPDKDEHITLLSLPPPEGGIHPISMLELSSLSMACPSGLYVVHFTCETVTDAKCDLIPAIRSLYHWNTDDSQDGSKPKVLWSLFFNIRDTTHITQTSELPSNLFIVSGPDGGLDFEHSIHEAKTLFQSLCPDEEFLPKAPNPEDIIFDDGDNVTNNESGFQGETQTEEDLNNAENEAREAKQADNQTTANSAE